MLNVDRNENGTKYYLRYRINKLLQIIFEVHFLSHVESQLQQNWLWHKNPSKTPKFNILLFLANISGIYRCTTNSITGCFQIKSSSTLSFCFVFVFIFRLWIYRNRSLLMDWMVKSLIYYHLMWIDSIIRWHFFIIYGKDQSKWSCSAIFCTKKLAIMAGSESVSYYVLFPFKVSSK